MSSAATEFQIPSHWILVNPAPTIPPVQTPAALPPKTPTMQNTASTASNATLSQVAPTTDSPPSSVTKKTKRARWAGESLRDVEDSFNINPNPSNEELQRLATKWDTEVSVCLVCGVKDTLYSSILLIQNRVLSRGFQKEGQERSKRRTLNHLQQPQHLMRWRTYHHNFQVPVFQILICPFLRLTWESCIVELGNWKQRMLNSSESCMYLRHYQQLLTYFRAKRDREDTSATAEPPAKKVCPPHMYSSDFVVAKKGCKIRYREIVPCMGEAAVYYGMRALGLLVH